MAVSQPLWSGGVIESRKFDRIRDMSRFRWSTDGLDKSGFVQLGCLKVQVYRDKCV